MTIDNSHKEADSLSPEGVEVDASAEASAEEAHSLYDVRCGEMEVYASEEASAPEPDFLNEVMEVIVDIEGCVEEADSI